MHAVIHVGDPQTAVLQLLLGIDEPRIGGEGEGGRFPRMRGIRATVRRNIPRLRFFFLLL